MIKEVTSKFKGKGKSGIRKVYLIEGVQRQPFTNQKVGAGTFSNLAFESDLEAAAYCKYHSKGGMFYTWHPITIGKFDIKLVTKKKTKKKVRKK